MDPGGDDTTKYNIFNRPFWHTNQGVNVINTLSIILYFVWVDDKNKVLHFP